MRQPLGAGRLCAAAVLLVAFTGQAGYAGSKPADEVRKALAGFIDALNNLDWQTFHG